MTTPLASDPPRAAIIGLDGAAFHMLDPVIEAGAMPALASLRERASEAVLRSTTPTYTPPAWVSMVTGVNPGRHGIFGFLANTPQERTTVAHSGMIAAPPMWRYLNQMDVPVGIFHVPMSYPPVEVDGFMVAGGLAAGWTQPELPNFASSPEIGRLVSRVAGDRYPVDTQVNYEKDWGTEGVVLRIGRVQRERRRVLHALLQMTDVRFLFAVCEGPDRLMHIDFQYLVEGSSWYVRPEAGRIRSAALSYFAELDRTIQDIVDWVGPQGYVAVVSDHGFGPWEKTVNVNLLLEEWGFLTLPSISHYTRLAWIAGGGQRLARRLVPRRLLHLLKAGVGSQIDWTRAAAFASHVAEQGVHINELGRMPHGRLDHTEAERLEQQLIERFYELADPHDGQAVVDNVIRSKDVIHGPFAGRSPNIFPVCRDYRYELSDTLAARSAFTDHRDRPWGYHHRDGVFLLAGPGSVANTFAPGLDIVDVLPTVFHAIGLPVPRNLDGEVVGGVLDPVARARQIVDWSGDSTEQVTTGYPFSPEEEADIEESLRGLGYID